ncbi:Mitochondrial substrate carrier family protein S (Carnitine/acylcarnitine translocase) (CAC) (Solute carrier family 25 member 20 homolog B) [Durusdinium trenchii]|uniref:Mitochondrial substrate carrier family protein S (Carnitine/acylcarnitine translocase) (CAC) (Solute carrier family 25 member 20 homolog B) n=1 Tax=Durusdinium trenchii TaxID=1381693 RepID=A0ABP0MA97_9DINO
MVSGFICKVVEYPADTIKVLEQTGGSRFSGPLDCFSKTLAESGFFSLYRGLSAPLLGSMAECASLFVSYGYVKKFLGVDEEAATLSAPVPFWKLVLAGGGSGFASTCVLTPVELIKCRLQAQLNQPTTSQSYRGPIDCILRTVRAEGVTGLWRGNLSTLAREVPGNMAWFGVYEAGMRLVQEAQQLEKKKDVALQWSALSGSAAGVAYWALPFPADTVKSKIQTDARFQSQSFISVFKTILKEEGVKGLYKGCGITCLRAIPSHALIFYFYEVWMVCRSRGHWKDGVGRCGWWTWITCPWYIPKTPPSRFGGAGFLGQLTRAGFVGCQCLSLRLSPGS